MGRKEDIRNFAQGAQNRALMRLGSEILKKYTEKKMVIVEPALDKDLLKLNKNPVEDGAVRILVNAWEEKNPQDWIIGELYGSGCFKQIVSGYLKEAKQ